MEETERDSEKKQTLLEFLIENNKEVSKWPKDEYVLATLGSNYQNNIPVFFDVTEKDYHERV